jgi:hypothetical protein
MSVIDFQYKIKKRRAIKVEKLREPLKPGTHELKFSASQLGAGTTGENTVLDVKYNLVVK